jgi:hypothetical protein
VDGFIEVNNLSKEERECVVRKIITMKDVVV